MLFLIKSDYFSKIIDNIQLKACNTFFKIVFYRKEFPILQKGYNLSIYFRNCYEQIDGYMFKNWIKKASELKIRRSLFLLLLRVI